MGGQVVGTDTCAQGMYKCRLAYTKVLHNPPRTWSIHLFTTVLYLQFLTPLYVCDVCLTLKPSWSLGISAQTNTFRYIPCGKPVICRLVKGESSHDRGGYFIHKIRPSLIYLEQHSHTKYEEEFPLIFQCFFNDLFWRMLPHCFVVQLQNVLQTQKHHLTFHLHVINLNLPAVLLPLGSTRFYHLCLTHASHVLVSLTWRTWGCIQDVWITGGLKKRLVIFYKLPTGYTSLSILSVSQSCMSISWSILTNQSQALNLDSTVIDSSDLLIDNSLPSSLANRYHSDIQTYRVKCTATHTVHDQPGKVIKILAQEAKRPILNHKVAISMLMAACYSLT